eukprot:INCI1449.1.p2 GENE.INCI1449.1~~INCI1449.1.p2  ORF type:complete len:111 (+),score=22.32 INCI1449.1:272-604(+)
MVGAREAPLRPPLNDLNCTALVLNKSCNAVHDNPRNYVLARMRCTKVSAFGGICGVVWESECHWFITLDRAKIKVVSSTRIPKTIRPTTTTTTTHHHHQQQQQQQQQGVA